MDAKTSNDPARCDGCQRAYTGVAVPCTKCGVDVAACADCRAAWALAETPYVCAFCRNVQGWSGENAADAVEITEAAEDEPDIDVDVDEGIEPEPYEDDALEDAKNWTEGDAP